MRRRQFLVGLVAVAGMQLCTSDAAMAQGFADEIVAQLRRQGFGNIVVERTWLGRIQILAERSDTRREIILSPSTGEILRDLWLSKSGKPMRGARISDDDDGDYDDGEDNSGHGGGDDDDDANDNDKDDNSGQGGGDD